MKTVIFYYLIYTITLASPNEPMLLDGPLSYPAYRNNYYNDLQSQINYHKRIINPIHNNSTVWKIKYASHLGSV